MAKVIAPVRPLLRVVANGSMPGARLRLTLIATPEPCDPNAPAAFELSAWPKDMADRLRRGIFAPPWNGTQRGTVHPAPFQVDLLVRRAQQGPLGKLAQPDGTPDDGGWRVVSARAEHCSQVAAPAWAATAEQWRRAFEDTAPAPWEDLAADIGRSLSGGKHKADPGPAAFPDEAHRHFRTGDTPAASTGIDTDGALLAPRPRPTDLAVLRGVIPLAQGDLAILSESTRAGRILAKQQAGPACFDDREDQEKSEAPTPAGVGAADRLVELRAQRLADFNDVLERTTPARALSESHFYGVRARLAGTPQTAIQLPNTAPLPRPGLIPDAVQVRSGTPGCPLQASHDYGTWLQRSPDFYWKDNKPPTVPSHEHQVALELPHDRIRGIYYALQGDPALSRLFCLAIDLVLDAAALEDFGRDVLLAAEWGGPGNRTPIVVTTARLDADSFWPFSIFEGGLALRVGGLEQVVRDDGLVEQQAGVWRAGQRTHDGPRYDLVSLDTRRAVESRQTGRDRGECHASTGLAVLDHERAAQVARDMALADIHAQVVRDALPGASTDAPRQVVLLHAEELTIGRRVDVAACAPGQPLFLLQGWRSLMHRTVRYSFGPQSGILAPALAALLGPGIDAQHHLDETSFQVAARYVPRLEGSAADEVPYDVLAEEAIFCWDGTPAAALTSQGPTDVKAQDTQPRLLFARTYGLPDPHLRPDLRPPPLRYGIPYVLGFRSVFLGGGSPSVEDASRARMLDGQLLMPAAPDEKAAPRRYLRHDGIRAPMLLFPVT